MFAYLNVALVEVLFSAFLLLISSLCQFQQDVVLNIFELNRWDPSLNDSFSEGIDMHLHKGHWSNEQVIASANEVNVQQEMIPNQTVNTFVIRYGIPWSELNHYLLGTVATKGALHIIKQKDVIRIRVKLKVSV